MALVEPMETGIDLTPPLVAHSSGDLSHYEESPVDEKEMLQDYYQQAVFSDGLQRIDRWTFILQDWVEQLGILEVCWFVLLLDGAKSEQNPANQVLSHKVFANK